MKKTKTMVLLIVTFLTFYTKAESNFHLYYSDIYFDSVAKLGNNYFFSGGYWDYTKEAPILIPILLGKSDENGYISFLKTWPLCNAQPKGCFDRIFQTLPLKDGTFFISLAQGVREEPSSSFLRWLKMDKDGKVLVNKVINNGSGTYFFEKFMLKSSGDILGYWGKGFEIIDPISFEVKRVIGCDRCFWSRPNAYTLSGFFQEAQDGSMGWLTPNEENGGWFIYKFDKDFNFEIAELLNIGDEILDFRVVNDGALILYAENGQLILFKLGNTGNILWQKKISFPDFPGHPGSLYHYGTSVTLHPQEDDSLVLAGVDDQLSNDDPYIPFEHNLYIIHLNEGGDVIDSFFLQGVEKDDLFISGFDMWGYGNPLNYYDVEFRENSLSIIGGEAWWSADMFSQIEGREIINLDLPLKGDDCWGVLSLNICDDDVSIIPQPQKNPFPEMNEIVPSRQPTDDKVNYLTDVIAMDEEGCGNEKKYPRILGVTTKKNPFSLEVTGRNLSVISTFYINGIEVPRSINIGNDDFLHTETFEIRGEKKLKKLLPKGKYCCITVRDSQGQTSDCHWFKR